MKIVETNPPNGIREACEKKFDLSNSTCIWTYGDTLYNPHKGNIDPFTEAHETVHTIQQGKDPDGWWEKYLASSNFRFKQELEAYRVEYRTFVKVVKDRNFQTRFLNDKALQLSGPHLGSLATVQQAKDLIRD